ncbi:hypothetical protein [Brevundimonas sp.]|uniref:hypothetical protein n=1 Tax=Brevundimonas sp. TaxID=1871086 RepID=UPI002D362059|nr:hypothetical protein [Brevundimonas sp.]HYD27491.1 hypothetical protein [Brevundimonas sp.]
MIGVLAAMMLTAAAQVQPGQAASEAPQDAPTRLEDVTITGRSLERMIGDFVAEVAEPNRGRRLARWDRSICVGVANLRAETAQYIVDRVSTVAGDIGLRAGTPGCTPNLLVVATADGDAAARALVTESRRAFRMGGAGMDRGMAALTDFQETDRPVRWWQVAMPTDSETGMRATRLSGDCQAFECNAWDGNAMGYAPVLSISSASRLNTQIVDNIFRTVVVVDVDEVSDLTVQQLADYIAMVSLAQIDPDADTGRYATILNVFDDAANTPGLTNWDLAYLGGLYQAERTDQSRAAGRAEIEASIGRAHARARAEADE